jgi:Calx-beta domain-containing protein
VCDHRSVPTGPPQFEAMEQRRLLCGSPAITINDVSLAEGEGGATAYTFTVSLSRSSSRQVSVNFATTDGSAVAGGDYARASGTLKFAPRQMTRTVTVLVSGDTAHETNETFFLNLSGARNAFIADAKGVGTILNDDAAPPVQDWPLPPPGEGDCNDGPYGCQ